MHKELQMTKSINMKQIAKLAGVSIATVSRVLNRNGRFSKETEERVLKIMKDNNYCPDNSVDDMWKNRNNIIGVVVPNITNPHFSDLVLQIQMYLFNNGYSTIICNTNESEILEKKHVKTLKAQNVAGLIVISGNRYHENLHKYPVVYLDRPHNDDEYNDAVVVESDNEGGGYMMANELLNAGCKNILFFMSRSKDVNQISRYYGFSKAFAERGIKQCDKFLQNTDSASIDSGKSAINFAIENGVKFDAVATTADTLAVGAYLALREHSIAVPNEVKIVGFDDCILAEICGNGITSVHQDVVQMANVAVDLLIRQINGEKISMPKRQIGVTLSKRASS